MFTAIRVIAGKKKIRKRERKIKEIVKKKRKEERKKKKQTDKAENFRLRRVLNLCLYSSLYASAITYQGRLYSQNTRLFLDHLGFLRYQGGLTDHLGLLRSVISWCGKMAGLFGHMDIHTSSATCLSKTRSTRFQGDQIPRQSPKIIWEECSLCLLNEANIRDTTS